MFQSTLRSKSSTPLILKTYEKIKDEVAGGVKIFVFEKEKVKDFQ